MSYLPKIIICANDVTQIGGVSRVVQTMGQAFRDAGYEVSLLGMNTADDAISYQGDSDKAADFPVSIAYPERPPVRAKDPARWLRLRGEAVGYLRRYLAEVRREKTIFIILQVYVMEHLLEAGFRPGEPGEPAVFGMYHSSYDSCVKVGDIERVREAYANATRFVCLTEVDRDKYASDGMTNVSYVYNPVQLMNEPEIPEWSEREKRVVFLGRFGPEKNVSSLVKIWSRIVDQVPDWRFEIYGVGQLRNEIAKEIFANDLTSSVHMMGSTQFPEEILANSRILVMFSEYEGLPVIIVEAGLCGIPSVVSDCAPGMSVLVKDGVSGYVVPKDDEEAFAEKLLELIKNQELNRSMGASAKEAMKEFDLPNIVAEWEKLFEQSDLI